MAVSVELQEFVDTLTEEKYNAKIAALDLAKLNELATDFNAKSNPEEIELINLDVVKDKYGLMVSLWPRRASRWSCRPSKGTRIFRNI
jgi:hypothetical protein